MKFRILQLDDKEKIASILAPLGRNDLTFGFAHLFSLLERYCTEISIENEVLLVRQRDRIKGAVAYFTPLGTNDVLSEVRKIQRISKAEGHCACLVNVTNDERQTLEQCAPGEFSFSADRNFADYLYLSETIAAYEGPLLAKKRRETNKFFQLYGSKVSFEGITLDIMNEVESFQRRWQAGNDRADARQHPLELEHRKILLDIRHFEELDLEGLVLRIDGVIEGYAYGSLLPGGAFDVMVLKGNLDYRFIWRALLKELAQRVKDRAPYLNLEEDLGLPGLRENKLSYQPCALLEKYVAYPV